MEEKYKVQLSFLVVLVAINEISLDGISEYAEKKYGFSEEDAFDLKSDMIREVFSLLLFNVDQAVMSETSLKEEFVKGIIKLLTDNLEAENLNFNIFSLFSKDGTLQETLSNILLENQETITSEHIIIEDKESSPTISNWLKDFIKINGSEMFDELKMAEYLSSSVNARKLKQSEKDLLRRLFRLYRNLSFFPDSMGNDPIEDWQIIPVDKIEINKKFSRPGAFQDVLDDSQPIIPLVSSLAPLNTKKLEDIPLNELQEALTHYASGSLEYKAVKQEIEHLKKKK